MISISNIIPISYSSEHQSKQQSSIQHRGKKSENSISPENIEDSDE